MATTTTTKLVRFSLHHIDAVSVVTGKSVLLATIGCVLLVLLTVVVWRLCRWLRNTRKLMLDPDIAMAMAPTDCDDDGDEYSHATRGIACRLAGDGGGGGGKVDPAVESDSYSSVPPIWTEGTLLS